MWPFKKKNTAKNVAKLLMDASEQLKKDALEVSTPDAYAKAMDMADIIDGIVDILTDEAKFIKECEALYDSNGNTKSLLEVL